LIGASGRPLNFTVSRHLDAPGVSSTVALSFRYTASDYARALRAHYASHLRLRLDAVVILVTAAAGIYLLRSSGSHWLGIVSLVASGTLALMILAAFTVMPILMFRREPKFRDQYSLRFSSDGIHFHTDHIDSQLRWTMYSRALIDAHSYVLYYGARQFTVIPKRAFDSVDQRDAFERLLTHHVSNITRIGVPDAG
jgi:hypothetical protein